MSTLTVCCFAQASYADLAARMMRPELRLDPSLPSDAAPATCEEQPTCPLAPLPTPSNLQHQCVTNIRRCTSNQAISEKTLGDFFDRSLLAEGVASGEINAAAVGVIQLSAPAGDPDVIFARGYPANTVNADTLFRAGSISKMVTWTALMQLVDQDKVNMSDDAAALAGLGHPFADPVSIWNLFTHSGGLEDNKFNFLLTTDPQSTLLAPLAAHVPAQIGTPVRDPTASIYAGYSSYGGALAGAVIEGVTKIPFDSYVENELFEKCGMTASTFRESTALPLEYENPAQQPEARPLEQFRNVAAAGSFSASANDMVQFMAAHLRYGRCLNGNRIMKEQTSRLMQSRAMAPSPYVNGSAYGFKELYINGRRILQHGGLTLYSSSILFLLPEEGVGLFVVYNTQPPSGLERAVAMSFVDTFFPAKIDPLFGDPGYADSAKEYAGLYGSRYRSYSTREALFGLLSEVEEVVATCNGTLKYTGAEWAKTEVPDVFRRLDRSHVIAFQREQGSVVHVAGTDATYPRHRLSDDEARAYRVMMFFYEIVDGIRKPTKPPAFHWLITAVGLWLLLTFDCLRRLRHSADPFPYARHFALLLAVPDVLIVAGLLLATDAMVFHWRELLESSPWYLDGTSALSIVSAVATIGALFCALLAWTKGFWPVIARVEYSLLALASAIFCCWLFHWNVMSFS